MAPSNVKEYINIVTKAYIKLQIGNNYTIFHFFIWYQWVLKKVVKRNIEFNYIFKLWETLS